MNENSPERRMQSHDAETLRLSAEILEKLTYAVGKDPIVAKPYDWLAATILVVRDRAVDRWMESTRGAYRTGAKRVYYLSLEFLIGRLLRDAMSNLGLVESIQAALAGLGVDLDMIEALEPDAALGNGGLGRLAACFMESMATVGIPAYGYGIRYVNGLFHQEIRDGNQIELPEDWLEHGQPVGVRAPRGGLSDRLRRVGERGRFGQARRAAAPGLASRRAGRRHRLRYADRGLARRAREHAPPVDRPGARSDQPRSLQPRRLYRRASERTKAETLTRVLYPADSTPAGQELRLRQEFFFVSASLQDLCVAMCSSSARPPTLRQGGDPSQRHPPPRWQWRNSCASSSTSTA